MYRILVVDDDPSLRAAVRRMLEGTEFVADEAVDGRDAVRGFRARPTDLVLCDLFMPVTDGIEVLRELARESPPATVIAMSGGGGGGRLDVLPIALALGAAAGLAKPFGRADLLGVARRLLASAPAKA